MACCNSRHQQNQHCKILVAVESDCTTWVSNQDDFQILPKTNKCYHHFNYHTTYYIIIIWYRMHQTGYQQDQFVLSFNYFIWKFYSENIILNHENILLTRIAASGHRIPFYKGTTCGSRQSDQQLWGGGVICRGLENSIIQFTLYPGLIHRRFGTATRTM